MANVELFSDRIVFSFPEVHPSAKCTVIFQRTLRLPVDGNKYPLPPGLGSFPIAKVSDHVAKLESAIVERGGVMVPMHQAEAMYIQFDQEYVHGHSTKYPFAIKIGTGKRSAITGKEWGEGLRKDDYCTVPKQPWIDGFVDGNGTVQQFVAAALGQGFTVEEQLTGKAEFGGLQIEVYPMKADEFVKRFPVNPNPTLSWTRSIAAGSAGGMGSQNYSASISMDVTKGVTRSYKASHSHFATESSVQCHATDEVHNISEAMPAMGAMPAAAASDTMDIDCYSRGSDDLCERKTSGPVLQSRSLGSRERATAPVVKVQTMGMAAGGNMTQEIYADPYDFSVWDRNATARVFVHLVNSVGWRTVTGRPVPSEPPSASLYKRYGLPWYEFYADGKALPGINGIKNVEQIAQDKGYTILPENTTVPAVAKPMPPKTAYTIKDGTW